MPGADKVSVNTAAVQRPELIGEIATEFGAQCCVCAIDAKRRPGGLGFEVYLHGGRTPTGIDAVEWALQAARLGAGEILLTSMDRDGTRDGYDIELTAAVAEHVGVPVIASGGVGTLEHLVEGVIEGGATGVLAASIFHFGEHTVAEAKAAMAAAGIAVRPSWRPEAVERFDQAPPIHQGEADANDITQRQDGVPPARSQRPQGLGAVVRELGDVRQPDEGRPAMECMQTAYDAGCNFFDNAEAYAGGRAKRSWAASSPSSVGGADVRAEHEVLLGHRASAEHEVNTLNRKYLMHAIDGSLERMGVDFVDLLYCHRADPDTPLEETVWAMSDIVSSGKALYWGTSEWAADEIRAAWEIAERHHLHKPVTEQPQYNLLERKRVEKEYARLYDRDRATGPRPGARWHPGC